MKQLFPFLFIIVLFSCNHSKTETVAPASTDAGIQVAPQPPATDSVVKDEDVIQSIRSKVQGINNMSLLVQTFDWSSPGCAEEGKISFYLNKDSIVKIIESGFIGDGGWTKEYYYDRGKFIFSFMQNIGGPASMPVDTSEVREYVNNDTLVLLKRNSEAHTGLKQKWNSQSTEYKLLRSFKNRDYAKVLCSD
ncbi:MAG: hypothetical protein QM687_07440 [Ferruginibacter sp.]